MKKPKKAPRPRAESPRGFRDYFAAEVVARQRMLDAICGVYRAYGFDPLESPAVETVEALGKFLPDVDRPNEGVFAWQDSDAGGDETWLALRYDLTAPLARVFAQHRRDLPSPYRRYAVGPVWRNEKPGPGRFRQFYQCDADTVGTPTVAADAEICMMLADALEAVGIARGDYLVRINDRKVLNGVMEAIGLWSPDDPEAQAAARGTVLRAVDKLDRLGEAGVRALLGRGREDESGDFTQGAGLSDAQADLVMGFVAARRGTAAGTCARLAELVGGSPTGAEGVAELETIAGLVEAQGYADRMVVDPSVVRGLGYYTGPVYEAELTFEIADEAGNRRQFGSVAGGGRYDDLIKRFTGETVPATGISIGVDRLLAALTAIGRAGAEDTAGPVVVLVMDRAEMAGYQTMCAELRRAGIRAEVFLGGGNMARQLKYADRRAAPDIAVIEGGDERAAQPGDAEGLGARRAPRRRDRDARGVEGAARADHRAARRAGRAGAPHARPARLMLGRPRQGEALAALEGALATLGRLFADAGHDPVAVPQLYLGETLLDLYGEDLRARAFLIPDAERGNELALRPDFTVPVALAHGAGGWERQAAYSYQGPVFRRQEPGLGRPVEYVQVGIERFGDPDPVAADAAVFALLWRGLAALGAAPAATIGDLSIPFALLDALEMPAARRAALRRHFWRPARFQALVARACRPPAPTLERRALVEAVAGPGPAAATAALMLAAGEPVGAREIGEVVARARHLAAEADEPPMPGSDARLIAEVLAVSGPAPLAADRLRRIAQAAGVGIGPAIDRFEARLAALEAQGIDTARLAFDAAFGRNLEYYDGFVFELRGPGGAPHPPLAGGGRYDAMTVRLGAPGAVPAVGGMVRPEAVSAAVSAAGLAAGGRR